MASKEDVSINQRPGGAPKPSETDVRPSLSVPRPAQLMREFHPDLFSDTETADFPLLQRPTFEYHLDSLTSRKQENEFEHFCLKLAQNEICPNLRPQTGPTGGGDSKVDTETYPVAPTLIERWWFGNPSAGSERWGFAFSAKKDWKPKAASDVRAIASTEREYTKIHFFTNQFVSDKSRAASEDDLSREVGVSVHIYDRLWITTKVYASDASRQRYYFEALGITDVQSASTPRPGPRDSARLLELETLDEQITDNSRYQGARYLMVEDCLRSAMLARGLERPRAEVEARFAQADNLSRTLNYGQQRMRIAYNRAWTAFWWYEDYSDFDRFYDDVEIHVRASDYAGDAELLSNLWNLLATSVALERIPAATAKLDDRTKTLSETLERIGSDTARPNNSLRARTTLVLMNTMRAYHARDHEEFDAGWKRLEELVDASAPLAEYPVETLFHIMERLGDRVSSASFDSLYDRLAQVMSTRRGRTHAGRAYSRRGTQKLQQDMAYEAIRWLGRAELLLLGKEESREELVVTLLWSASAYQRVGLLWAARNRALTATSHAMAGMDAGRFDPVVLVALGQLTWYELQLGRVPHVLEARTLWNSVVTHTETTEEQRSAYLKSRTDQDIVLGIYVLCLPLKALSRVRRLPDVLEKLGFECSRNALLYALGHEDLLREEGYLPESENEDEVREFFGRWQDYADPDDLAMQPTLSDGSTRVLESTILGCRFEVETESGESSVSLGETVLGALESLMATSEEQRVMPRYEGVRIVISPEESVSQTPRLDLDDDDSREIKILHPRIVDLGSMPRWNAYSDWLRESVIRIACSVFLLHGRDGWLEEVVGQQLGVFRAVGIGETISPNRRVFGEGRRISLKDWVAEENQEFEMRREEVWRIRDRERHPRPTVDSKRDLASSLNTEALSHRDYQVRTPIDLLMWERARWRATMFVTPPRFPPVLAIGFEDKEAALAIFRVWKERWGEEEADEGLRVAVVRGIDDQKPAAYAVVVGAPLGGTENTGRRVTKYLSQINRMFPESTTNLDRFLQAYEDAGGFLFAPVHIRADRTVPDPPCLEVAVGMRKLQVREAWTIGENDPDRVAIEDGRKPVTPASSVSAGEKE